MSLVAKYIMSASVEKVRNLNMTVEMLGIPSGGSADGGIALSVKLNRAFRVRRLRTTHRHYTELLTLN